MKGLISLAVMQMYKDFDNSPILHIGGIRTGRISSSDSNEFLLPLELLTADHGIQDRIYDRNTRNFLPIAPVPAFTSTLFLENSPTSAARQETLNASRAGRVPKNSVSYDQKDGEDERKAKNIQQFFMDMKFSNAISQ